MPRRRRKFSRGFALIEAIGAFAIFALTMLALSLSVSQAARSDLRAEFELAAVRIARSEFDRLGVDRPLTAGEQIGASDNLEWRMELRPYRRIGRREAYLVTIFIRDAKHAFSMSTVKIDALKEDLKPL